MIGFKRIQRSRTASALLLAAAIAASLTPPLASAANPLMPTTVFAQAGIGDEATRAYIGGATWDWRWRHEFSSFVVTGYFEAAAGRWIASQGQQSGSAWATQIGITPVLRFRPASGGPWFGEIGVGGNYILPLYRSGQKEFSTKFNFGDHFAIGRAIGKRKEIALRLEHFSNAGISHPNPGENFVQLRYTYRL